jgi:hypothetical protein
MNSGMEKKNLKKSILRRALMTFILVGALAAIGFFLSKPNSKTPEGSSFSSETSIRRQVGHNPEKDFAEFNGINYRFLRGDINCAVGSVTFDSKGKDSLLSIGRMNFSMINAGNIEEQIDDNCRSVADTFSNTEQGPVERMSGLESRETITCKAFKIESHTSVRISASSLIYDVSSTSTDPKQVVVHEHCEYLRQ